MRSSSKINLRASSMISLELEGQSLEALPQRYYLQGWWWSWWILFKVFIQSGKSIRV